MKTYAMMVLGCKVNDYEATYLKEQLNKDYLEVDFKQEADIYIIFTCAVTNTAEAKTRKFFHKARRQNPDAYIIAVGCLSQIKGDTKDFDDIDLIIGSDKKDQILDYIKANVKDNVVSKEISKEFENLVIESYPGKSRSFLKVQDGCNQFCSYCVIPYSRGRERSGNHLKLIETAKSLAKHSKEIVLTGIHTGRYNDGEYNLYMLLKDLCEIDGLETIRLSSIEITEITDDIIELMMNNKKIAHHLHIPVQAASNEVLSAMNRPYTIEEFIERIEYIRKCIPDVSISTDLIVGFPNETDEIFSDSLKALDRISFSFIHCFPYSRKTGTVADKMSGHIDERVKSSRVHVIENFEIDHTFKYNSSFIGKEIEVLVEKNSENKSYGYSKQYFYCEINEKLNIGDIYKVKVINVTKDRVECVCC